MLPPSGNNTGTKGNTQDEEGDTTTPYHPIDLTPLKSLIFKLSGVKATMSLQLDYNPEKVARMSQKSLLQATARMDNHDLNEFPKWIAILKELLSDSLDLIEDKKKSRARSKIDRTIIILKAFTSPFVFLRL